MVSSETSRLSQHSHFVLFTRTMGLAFLFTLALPSYPASAQDAPDNRTPVPSAREQAAALKLIRDVYKEEYESDSFETLQTLAQQLIVDARESKDEPAQHYAILRESIRVATDNCDPQTAVAALDRLNRTFQVDFWGMTKSISESLVRKAKTNQQRRRVRDAFDDLVNQAITDEQFSAARLLVSRATTVAKKLGNKQDADALVELRKEIQELGKIAQAGKSAAEKLATTPDDPDANLDAGDYLIYVKLEFRDGLGHWEKSSKPELVKLAKLENAIDASQSANVLTLADSWMKQSERFKGLRAKTTGARALHWYEQVLDQLDDKTKSLTQAKIDKLKSVVAVRSANNKASTPVKLAPETREAVDAALKWILYHQLPDGGWNLDHRVGPGVHRDSSKPGKLIRARLGATSLALLSLIKAGHTHKSGQFKTQVEKGVGYLLNSAKVSGNTVSFHETGGTMYSHALATKVLAELYAATKDKRLAGPAQGAVNFIAAAQDPTNGGWRYQVRSAGDTSVTGWQIDALRSAQKAGLNIDPNIATKANFFLDTVMKNDQTAYGYTSPPNRREPFSARTAIALRCRLDFGWKAEDVKFQNAFTSLAEEGPSTGSRTNIYFNYHATKLMHVYGGEAWEKWRTHLHADLLKNQSTEGNETGSWWLRENNHADDSGGRLYVTSLATLILLEGTEKN